MTITVVGSTMMDIVFRTEHYPQRGDTVFGQEIRYSPGGKGANQATACAKLGAETYFIGCVGDDSFGQTLFSNLQSNHVNVEHMQTVSDARTGIAQVTVDSSAENTILVVKGANDSLTIEDIQACEDTIRKSRILLVQMEIREEVTRQAMIIARKHGITVVLDPAPADGIRTASLRYADIIVPNQQEAKVLTHIDVHDVPSAIEAAIYLHEHYGIAKSIIKLGGQGSLVYQDGECEHIHVVSVRAVDTVGAGDSYAGALAFALAEGKSLTNAAKFASIVSALKVTKHGAQDGIPTMKEVKAFCLSRNLTLDI
ncbi:ribokinase [Paenibacillus nasutitermitis]|uniref:Deoxyribokinase n=1 Tax=Paenibacillus nasutitermitis TaxID=1652958 RepID=A0A916Z8B3_9BACL|nr:ribokinase [Paenibacillus nasutitermitis]GGD80096.1 ribokinase [Paenibacillus nasutitermitis]